MLWAGRLGLNAEQVAPGPGHISACVSAVLSQGRALEELWGSVRLSGRVGLHPLSLVETDGNPTGFMCPLAAAQSSTTLATSLCRGCLRSMTR